MLWHSSSSSSVCYSKIKHVWQIVVELQTADDYWTTVLTQQSGALTNTDTFFLLLMQNFNCKWWGTKSTKVLLLCKNVFKSLFEDNMKLQRPCHYLPTCPESFSLFLIQNILLLLRSQHHSCVWKHKEGVLYKKNTHFIWLTHTCEASYYLQISPDKNYGFCPQYKYHFYWKRIKKESSDVQYEQQEKQWIVLRQTLQIVNFSFKGFCL